MSALLEGGWNMWVFAFTFQWPMSSPLTASPPFALFLCSDAFFQAIRWCVSSPSVILHLNPHCLRLMREQIENVLPANLFILPSTSLLLCWFVDSGKSCVLCPADYQQLADWPCATQRYCIVALFVYVCLSSLCYSDCRPSGVRPAFVCDWVDQTFANCF